MGSANICLWGFAQRKGGYLVKTALIVGLLVVLVPQAVRADEACLRGDKIDRISMTGSKTAVAGSLEGGKYRITFATPCGARHIGTFFISNPDHLPKCIGPGTALQTNSEGVCMVKAITRL
jgi:hypothetical protein